MATLTIEGFATDLAFTDQSKNVSSLYPSSTSNVGELSSNARSYFNSPVALVDKRLPTGRSVNWAAQTRPQIVFDESVFSTFTSAAAAFPTATMNQIFAIVDKLLFNYNPSSSPAQIEADLTTNVATKDAYVAKSFNLSTLIVSDNVFTEGNAPKTVSVPSYAIFDITVPSGSTARTFSLKIYTGVEAWLTGYSQSVIVEVVPPLPYNKLFEEALLTSTDNIFSTASITASLSYNTLQSSLRNTVTSGMMEFRAVLQDSSNTVGVPFNILYKGRVPTLFEIRNAIRQKLLTSGVSDEAGWKKRLPGVFVSGRFYVVPMWDKVFDKPNQSVYPNVLNLNAVIDSTAQILSTLGYGKNTEFMDILPIYYNHMTAVAVPDQSGVVDVKLLSQVMPDYQSYSASDEQFNYMSETTKAFTRELNTVLAVATNNQTSSVYGPNTEGLLSFYSYTAGTYEVCVITRSCYLTIMGSEQ